MRYGHAKQCSKLCHQRSAGKQAAKKRHTAALSLRPSIAQPLDRQSRHIAVGTTGTYTVVSTEDYEIERQHAWSLHTAGYAYRRPASGAVTIHRSIAGRMLGRPMAGWEYVDHINHNKLDNRRSNLRVCSATQNQANRVMARNNVSGYRGVYWNNHRRIWQAAIKLDQKHIYIGQFAYKEEAAYVFDQFALELFGEDSYLIRNVL